jgi:hypothetical protein
MRSRAPDRGAPRSVPAPRSDWPWPRLVIEALPKGVDACCAIVGRGGSNKSIDRGSKPGHAIILQWTGCLVQICLNHSQDVRSSAIKAKDLAKHARAHPENGLVPNRSKSPLGNSTPGTNGDRAQTPQFAWFPVTSAPVSRRPRGGGTAVRTAQFPRWTKTSITPESIRQPGDADFVQGAWKRQDGISSRDDNRGRHRIVRTLAAESHVRRPRR